jgi:hypothetical protein
MPLYTFKLREGSAPLSDNTGIQLPDREHASAYAKEVARELMRGRESEARSWRLDVEEDSGEWTFALPFVTIDPTLDHLGAELRSAIERTRNSHRSWREAVYAARTTVRQSRALIARSRGKPYLAAIAGEPTIG